MVDINLKLMKICVICLLDNGDVRFDLLAHALLLLICFSHYLSKHVRRHHTDILVRMIQEMPIRNSFQRQYCKGVCKNVLL